jgi:hypothetical protein
MSVGKADYSKSPFTSGSKPHYSERLQSMHLAVAHLRCFDARLTTRGEVTSPNGPIRCNWWDRNNDFIRGVRRVPPYTFLYWTMLFKIAPYLGGLKKLILEAKTPKDVDAIRKMRVTLPVPDEHNEGEIINMETPLLSTNFRAMIDNMLFVGCYGHKQMFEDRVPQSSILAFRNAAVKIAREQEDSFYYLWKEHLNSNGTPSDGAVAAQAVEGRVSDVMGRDDDGEGYVAPAAAGGNVASEAEDAGDA